MEVHYGDLFLSNYQMAPLRVKVWQERRSGKVCTLVAHESDLAPDGAHLLLPWEFSGWPPGLRNPMGTEANPAFVAGLDERVSEGNFAMKPLQRGPTASDSARLANCKAVPLDSTHLDAEAVCEEPSRENSCQLHDRVLPVTAGVVSQERYSAKHVGKEFREAIADIRVAAHEVVGDSTPSSGESNGETIHLRSEVTAARDADAGHSGACDISSTCSELSHSEKSVGSDAAEPIAEAFWERLVSVEAEPAAKVVSSSVTSSHHTPGSTEGTSRSSSFGLAATTPPARLSLPRDPLDECDVPLAVPPTGLPADVFPRGSSDGSQSERDIALGSASCEENVCSSDFIATKLAWLREVSPMSPPSRESTRAVSVETSCFPLLSRENSPDTWCGRTSTNTTQYSVEMEPPAESQVHPPVPMELEVPSVPTTRVLQLPHSEAMALLAEAGLEEDGAAESDEDVWQAERHVRTPTKPRRSDPWLSTATSSIVYDTDAVYDSSYTPRAPQLTCSIFPAAEGELTSSPASGGAQPRSREEFFRVNVPQPFPGIQYRRSKDLNDRDDRYAAQGSVVAGQLEGDWLRLDDNVFLPHTLGDDRVLEPIPDMSPDNICGSCGSTALGDWRLFLPSCLVSFAKTMQVDFGSTAAGSAVEPHVSEMHAPTEERVP